MTVSSFDGGQRADGIPRGRRIMMSLGGCDHVLSVAEATELRNDLTRELGAPEELTRELGALQALTDREAMVWAEDDNAQVRDGIPPRAAAVLAAVAVNTLRGIASGIQVGLIDPGSRAMLVAMTGGGR